MLARIENEWIRDISRENSASSLRLLDKKVLLRDTTSATQEGVVQH